MIPCYCQCVKWQHKRNLKPRITQGCGLVMILKTIPAKEDALSGKPNSVLSLFMLSLCDCAPSRFAHCSNVKSTSSSVRKGIPKYNQYLLYFVLLDRSNETIRRLADYDVDTAEMDRDERPQRYSETIHSRESSRKRSVNFHSLVTIQSIKEIDRRVLAHLLV